MLELMGRLVVDGTVHLVRMGDTTVGRDPDSDVFLQQKAVSNSHAIIEIDSSRISNKKFPHTLALVYSLCWRGVGVAPSADINTRAAPNITTVLTTSRRGG